MKSKKDAASVNPYDLDDIWKASKVAARKTGGRTRSSDPYAAVSYRGKNLVPRKRVGEKQ